ncbi:MAG: biopolymer transporter ExbD [Planctomycetes bacterium]|nr:biopolymer transporter ExbD [Planctomycetota bacterium]
MNVIPMVDIMFLLLLFFMLTADFGGRELEEVKLADGKSVAEDKQDEAKGRMNLNIFHTPTTKNDGPVVCADFDADRVCHDSGHWNIAIRGKRYGSDSLETWAKDQAYWYKKEKQGMDDVKAKDFTLPCELRIMVRCDSRAPFQFPQLVMEKMGKAAIYKIEYGAAAPTKK